MIWKWRATIRIKGAHDFEITIMAPDQIAARRIIESKYGRGCILGDNVWRV
jgi:hypothetical protein